jgi:hypothetical protein
MLLSVEIDAGAEQNLEQLLLYLVVQPLVRRSIHLGRWNAGWDQSRVQLVHQTRPKTHLHLNEQSA